MRVLIVGRGRRGRAWERLVRRRRGTELAGTVDPDPAAGASWDALCPGALSDADAAIIASPSALHAEHALSCLEAGLGVLVEKPLALTLADARAVVDAAQQARLPAVVAHNFPERGLERAVEAALYEMGALRAGIIVSSRARSLTPAIKGVEHPILWDFGIHHFDLIRRRVGGPPHSVVAGHAGNTYRVSFRWRPELEVSWWHHDEGELFHRAEWWRSERGAVEVRGGRAWQVLEGRRPRRLRLPRGSAEMRLLDGFVSGDSNVSQTLSTVAMAVATEAAIASGSETELGELVELRAP